MVPNNLAEYKKFKEQLKNKEVPENFPWETWEEFDAGMKRTFDKVFYGKEENTPFGKGIRLSEDCIADLLGGKKKKK